MDAAEVDRIADAVASRVVARLREPIADLEGAIRDGTRASAAHTRAVGRVRDVLTEAKAAEGPRHQELVRVHTEARDALRDLAARLPPPAPPPTPDPVDQATTQLQVNAISKVSRALDALTGAPGRLIAWAAENRLAAGALLATTSVALGGFLLQLAQGAPLMVALGEMLIALGSGGALTGTGGAP